MRRTSAFGACLAIIVAMLCPNAASAGAEKKATRYLNKIRLSHGLNALRSSGALAQSAAGYARHMFDAGFFGHGSRIMVSSEFRTAGETLAWHSGFSARPRETVQGWMASPPHRDALLSSQYGWVGMAAVHGRFSGQPATMWVAHVGSR